MVRPTLFAIALASLAGGAVASGQSDSKSPFTVTAFHRFSTDIDGGGEVSSQTYFARTGFPLLRGDGRFAALSLAYGIDAYDFSGGGFSEGTPWGDVHSLRLGLPTSFDFGDRWSFFGLPNVRSVREVDADFGDSISGGAIAGLSYRFGEKLSLGPGVGYIAQLEDDASVFPVVFVDWQLTDALSLSTGPTIGATHGPGLALNYEVSDRLLFSVGARYKKLRFRLDDSFDEAPGGVGEDRTFPLFGAVSYQANNHWRLSLLGGVGFAGELRVEDAGGKPVREADFDPAPFIGLHAAFAF